MVQNQHLVFVTKPPEALCLAADRVLSLVGWYLLALIGTLLQLSLQTGLQVPA
jgi:hypothetical protein